jgi:hypothetical protein
MAMGYVAEGLGYRTMWTTVCALLLAGFAASFRLSEGARPPAPGGRVKLT